MSENLFDRVPKEILKAIFEWCDGDSLFHLYLTCKRFNENMDEDFWKRILLRYAKELDFEKNLSWNPCDWNEVFRIAPHLRWRHLVLNLGNPTQTGYSYSIEQSKKEWDFITLTRFGPDYREQNGIALRLFFNGGAHYGQFSCDDVYDGYSLHGKGIWRIFKIRTNETWYATFHMGQRFGNVTCYFDNGIVFKSEDNYSEGGKYDATMTWPCGYAYSGKWKGDQWFPFHDDGWYEDVPKNEKESIPLEIHECIEKKKCTRTITKEKILPQLMKKGFCFSCIPHQPSVSETDAELWVKDGVCNCDCDEI
eukprot:TRINITY_DN1797_c0_g1_i1.p1 TRINITY_DN1797_c0_g1~~TRINITY_DN1797_c0_g1_i1.p1  ORF type:complete len:308 (-),score=53.59 TRINITY_DN1797_c0_g1_i1:18-941(-)